MYNVVFGNSVQHNFGGGIKIVRTGYFNLIGLNVPLSNNDGASDGFTSLASNWARLRETITPRKSTSHQAEAIWCSRTR